MKKTRRLTALLTTISIIFGVLSTAMAGTPLGTPDQSTGYSNSRGDVIFSVLGTTPADNDKSGKGGSYYQGTMDAITKPVDGKVTWEENGLLWLQISVKNMSRLRDMFNSGTTDSNAMAGLNSASMAIAYDTDYFSLPSNTSNYGAAQTKRLLQGNYPKTYNDSYVSPLYDFGQEPSTYNTLYNASGKDTIKEPTLKQYITQKNADTPDYTKIGIYKINTKNISDNTQADDSLLFQDGAVPVYDKADTIDYSNLTPVTNDEFTMFLIPLKMKGTSAPEGKVIESYFDGSLSTMIVGTSANADEYVLYSYDDRRSQNAATNLNNRINIVDNLVEAFPTTYTVTYDAGEGTFKDSVTVGTDNIEKVAENKNPTLKNNNVDISSMLNPPTGKIFKEWQTTDNTKFDSTYLVKEDITVTAVYDDGYNVNFNLNAADATYADGKTDLKSITLGKTESPEANAIATTVGGDPIRSGYTFKGWYTKKNGAFDQKYTDDGADGSTAITAITGQTDLYAMWDNGGNGNYKLTFDSNRATGATGTDADPNVVGYNNNTDTLTSVIGGLPTEPTTSQADYKFIGWYKNQAGDGEKLTASTPLLAYTGATDNSGTNVYAKWGYVNDPDPDNPDDPNPNTNTVTITFPKDGDGTYNGGTSDNGTLNDRYIKYNETVPNLPTAMTYDGKGFIGWYTKPQADDGSIPTDAKKVEATTAIDSTFGVDATNGGTVSLYAYWADKVTVSYDLNGSPTGGTAPDSETLVPGAKFTPKSTTVFDGTDYKFKEWNTEKNGSGTSYTPGTEATVPNEDTILYAIWNYDESKADAVSVTFDGNDTTQFPATLTPNNGASDTNKYTIVRQAGTTIASDYLPKATRSTAGTTDNKYTLNHWDTTKTAPAGAQQTITVTADEGTKAMNVYAIWTVTNDADKATVTFKKVAEDTSAYATVVIAKGDVVGPQMPANPTRTDGYNFSKWLKGTDEFKADTVVNDATTEVVGDWTKEIELAYDKNGLPDAVTVPATEKGAENDKKTVGNITANGAQVELVKWNTEPDGSGTSYQPGDEITLGTDKITLYAIWNSTDPNAKTITFHANDSTTYKAKLNGVEQKTVTMKRATGQTITAAQMPKATRDKYKFDHWGATATEAAGTTTADITVGTENIDRYAIWTAADGETSYNVTFNLHDGATPTTVGPIAVVAGDTLGDRMPANPTRENGKYTFNKWTTGTGASKTDFSNTTQINAATTVDANWSIKVDVKFTKSEFDYDGNSHTPITDGNYVVFLKGTTTNPLTGLTLSTDKYLKVTGKDESQDPPTYTTEELPSGVSVPIAGGEYKFGTLTLTEAGGDGFTEYDINTIPATFKIKAKEVELTIDKNYQYIGSGETISDIAVASADTNVNTALTGGDIKVTFTDKNNNDTETTTMPTTYGHYTIKIESANDNYSFTVKDKFGATGDAIPMYLINLQREIKVDYMEGTSKNPSSDVYATVTLAKPATLNDTSSAKTTLATQTTALDVPQSGTNFDPPTGKRIKKFVTGTKSGNTINDQADFDKNTVISFSETNEALTIYAIYENADWTLTFSDTKTNPAAETFDAYTIDAEKSVKDGLSKKGSAAVTNPADKTLPAPTAAPANQMFKGWTTDENIAKEANLTSADFETVDGTDGKYKGKLFTDDTVPTATELGDDNAITVYAVYVKSSDATLKAASFKEILVDKDNDGNPTGTETEKAELPYTNADYTTPNDPITFDPDTDTYTIVVKNDFEKVLANLEPTQPGSTIKITANGTELTDSGYTSGNRSQKSEVAATTFDGTKNSVNTIVATVTAPDGTTKDYTFNVLRYAEVTVKLKAGNSPYGLIERMGADYVAEREEPPAGKTLEVWDAQKIQDAKDEFLVNNYKYANDLVPEKGDKNFVYTEVAWNSYRDENDQIINYDLDPTALFVYQLDTFKVPEIKAYDEFDREINIKNTTFKIKEQSAGVCKYDGATDTANGVTEIDAPLVSGTTDTYTLENNIIRNDRYFIEYEFDYTLPNGDPLKAKRPVIVLSKLGDLSLSNPVLINDGDVNHLKKNTTLIYGGHSLIAYRIADLVADSIINDGDANELKKNTTAYYARTNQYYTALN